MIRTVIATVAVLMAAAAAFASLTHGFRAMTAETARRQTVAARPIAIPPLAGLDQFGRHQALVDTDDARVAIVDFIYTRCASVCLVLGDSYQQLQAQILAAHLERRVRLVTVSFDPQRDTRDVIAAYAARMRVDPAVWTVLAPEDPAQLQAALNAFGVIVKPVDRGQFVHNAAFHILDRQGRLARIVSIDQPRRALEVADEISARP